MQKLKTHLQSIKRTQWTHPHLVEERKKKEATATADKNGNSEDGKDLKFGIEFVAETIVRVHLDEPLVDVKLFKVRFTFGKARTNCFKWTYYF